MNISNVLKRISKENDLNQVELGEALGVSQGYVSKIMSGATKNPSIKLLKGLREKFSVDVNALLDK